MLSFLIHQSQNSYVILLWVDYTRPAQNFISFLEGFGTKYTYVNEVQTTNVYRNLMVKEIIAHVICIFLL